MTESGSDNEADLWANTGNQPTDPPVPPLTTEAPGAAADPTLVQPALPSDPTPTTVQPTTPGPLDTPAPGGSRASYVTGPGGTPPAPPPAPPAGGPGGPGGPNGPGQGRPAWVAPTAIGLGVAVLAAGLLYIVTRDGGDDAVSTDVTSTIVPETTIEGETTIPTDTTIVPDTTIETDTTIATETTVAPTTAAPTTAAPTTAAPTTAAPTTAAAAAGITPAQPGQALVAGEAYDLVSGCTTNPVPGYSVRSYLAMGGSGPLIIEAGNDEGNVFGFFSDAGAPVDTGEFTALGEGFGMVASQGGGSFEVAVNPGGIALGDCSTRGSARLSDPAAPEFGYTYGVVDICATTAPLRAIAYISESGNIRVVDNGDGTARVTLNSTDLFDATDDAATLTSSGGRQVITGEVTGSTIDGETTQAIQFEFDNSSTRACTGNESP